MILNYYRRVKFRIVCPAVHIGFYFRAVIKINIKTGIGQALCLSSEWHPECVAMHFTIS